VEKLVRKGAGAVVIIAVGMCVIDFLEFATLHLTPLT
jgi:hypothetical protein